MGCSAEPPLLLWTEQPVSYVGQYVLRPTDKPDHLE